MPTFRVLGPLHVGVAGEDRTPSASKVRQVMALTLLRANHVVSLDTLTEELWGDCPPRSAVSTAQTYIYQIRRLLADDTLGERESRTIRTAPPGYVLTVGPGELDAWEFEHMLEQARVHIDFDRREQAVQVLDEALELWNGHALADVTQGPLLQRYAAQLEERRILALELRLSVNMSLGRHRQLVAELKALSMSYPYHEWFHAQLMIALQRSGRRAEALSAFHQARQLLNDQLGVEPSADLRLIHQSILEEDELIA